MTKAKSKPKKLVVQLDAKPRKSSATKTSYSKERPSAYAWKPGESGNAAGRKRSETRLLSKALNVFLSDHAPEDAAKAMGLPVNGPGGRGGLYHYSWAQILAKRILNLAIRGEPWAVSEIARLTEPAHARLSLGGFDNEGIDAAPAIVELIMVEADGDGRISRESLRAFPELGGRTIEGQPWPALPDPED